MASKPVESQTCNPQSCVECRLDDNHWFTAIYKWQNKNRRCCTCSLRWDTFNHQQPNPCSNTGHCDYFCYSGIYHASDGYIYTRNSSVHGPDLRRGICRRPA